MNTPKLRELIRIPEYRAYFTQPVARAVPINLRHDGQTPWRVWVHKQMPDRPSAPPIWAKADKATFRDAYDLVRRALRAPDVVDVSLTCRPKGFEPTIKLRAALAQIDGMDTLDWCKHCRRPVEFGYFRKHHAYALMGHAMYTASESARCPFCGTRKVAQ